MKTLYEQNQNLPTVMTASKQQTIADTARRLFREHGFSAVSVGGICTEAAVSRVTFYKYYSGKNALLQEIVTEQKNRVRAEFENLLAPDSARFAGGTHRPVHPSVRYIDAPSATGRALCRYAAKAAAGRIGVVAARFGGRRGKERGRRLSLREGERDSLHFL